MSTHQPSEAKSLSTVSAVIEHNNPDRDFFLLFGMFWEKEKLFSIHRNVCAGIECLRRSIPGAECWNGRSKTKVNGSRGASFTPYK